MYCQCVRAIFLGLPVMMGGIRSVVGLRAREYNISVIIISLL